MQVRYESWVWSLGWEDPLEEGTATHFSILNWWIRWTEEPGGLQFIELQRVGHDWSDFVCKQEWLKDLPGGWVVKKYACYCSRHRRFGLDPWVRKIPWRRNWQPTPVFLPGNPIDSGAWLAPVIGVAKSQTGLIDGTQHSKKGLNAWGNKRKYLLFMYLYFMISSHTKSPLVHGKILKGEMYYQIFEIHFVWH